MASRSNIDAAMIDYSVLRAGNRYGVINQTLAGTFTMDEDMPQLVLLDPNGSARTVLLPLATGKKGLYFWIFNLSSGSAALTVKDSTGVTTIGTVAAGGAGHFFVSPVPAGSGSTTATWMTSTASAPASVAATGKVSSSSPSAGVGYATGAGGTATQTTNRTTTAVMSPAGCMSGTVTTDTTSLAAEASAEFQVTNTSVEIGDVIIPSIRSGSNGGNTAVTVTTVAAGSFKFRVSNNNAAGGTAETGALIINYAVIKAVSA